MHALSHQSLPPLASIVPPEPPRQPQPTKSSASSQQQQQQQSTWASSNTVVATVPSTPTTFPPNPHPHPSSTIPITTPETTRKRTAAFVAHNTCAMVCYLWFGHPRAPHPSSPSPSPSPNPYSPTFTLPPTDPALARLQFVPSKAFVEFMHSLLTTTQVSQSVIVLSLHYIYRLKCANPEIKVMEGSELRLAVAALMLANKFLDDNTYTNLTWSQISHIALPEINLMEREFLAGVAFNLFVDQKAYDGWLLMLNGLMWAKEREYEGWRKTWCGTSPNVGLQQREKERTATMPRQQLRQQQQPVVDHRRQNQYPTQIPRARSTSPTASYPFTFTLPPLQEPRSNPFIGATAGVPPSRPPTSAQQQHPPLPPPIPVSTRPTGSKRSALDAALSPEIMPVQNKRRPVSSVFPMGGGMDYTLAPPPPPQRHPQVQHQLAPPLYRTGTAPADVDDRSAGSSCGDRSRSSSAEGRLMDGNGGLGLAAGLGRMSLEPQSYAVKKEEVDEDEDLRLLGSFGGDGDGGVLQLSAPYRPDERLVGRGVPKYLQFNMLVASPSVTVDPRYHQQHQEEQQQQPTLTIPPPQLPTPAASALSSQFYPYTPQSALHAHGNQRKTVMRYQVHQPVVQQQQRQLYSRTVVEGARSARTSPTVMHHPQHHHHQQYGHALRMDVDAAPVQQHQQRLQQQQQQPAMQYVPPQHLVPSPAGRLPPLSTPWHSNNNAALEPFSALPTPPPQRYMPSEQQQQLQSQQSSNFANAGPPGYAWRSSSTSSTSTSHYTPQQQYQQQIQRQQSHSQLFLLQQQQQPHFYGYSRPLEPQQQTL